MITNIITDYISRLHKRLDNSPISYLTPLIRYRASDIIRNVLATPSRTNMQDWHAAVGNSRLSRVVSTIRLLRSKNSCITPVADAAFVGLVSVGFRYISR